MNTRMLIAVAVSMFVCQQVYAQQPAPEGTWEVVSLVLNGQQAESDWHFWRFEDNRIYGRQSDDEDWTSHGTFSTNETAMPAEIELTSWDGIYELDGDSLTICYSKARPERFESTEDYPTRLYVLRRVEEDDE